MLFSNVTPTTISISWVYLPFCLPKCIFLPSSPYLHPPPPQKKKKKNHLVYLPVRLSARLSVCFSVCIRKQVSITWKFHNYYDDKTHDSTKAYKVEQSVFCLFSSAKYAELHYKITTNFTTELASYRKTTHTMGATKE